MTRVARPLRATEAAAVIAACGDGPAGRRDAALVSVMREALLRAGEAAALVWDDWDVLDDGRGVVRIGRSKTDPDGRRRVGIPVSDRAAARMEAWRADAPRSSVFGLSGRSVAYVVERAGRRAGIEGLSGHSCRRGGAQDMALAGRSAAEIMARGRWARIETAQRYIAEVGGDLARRVPGEVVV